ncbi:hypothetical protein Lfu02_04200 [Longispora fulva]|nr:hypothetical protein Lfu02_04200 [Longispora fulva]
MATDEPEHMTLIQRRLAGDVINNTVGINIIGGPFDGRTRIVDLGEHGTPPARLRARRGLPDPPADRTGWHTYEAVLATDTPAGWIYKYVGTNPPAQTT